MDEVLTELAGTVRSVIYQNEENGYTVLAMESTDGEDFTAVGCLPFAAPGEQMVLQGTWKHHPSHGEQFSVETAQRMLPVGKDAIYEYLASRTVRGIGPATAMILVGKFGDDTLEILENHPEQLAALRGIGTRKAREMSESFRRQVGLRRLTEFLAGHGLRAQLAMRLYQYYGDDASAMVRENPYVLCTERIGAAFREADALAVRLGFDGDSPERIAAAVLYEMSYNSGNGHVFIPFSKLMSATAALIGVEAELVEESMEVLIESGEIVREAVAGQDACYLARLWEAEHYAAARLIQMAAARPEIPRDLDGMIARIEKQRGIAFAEYQRNTLEMAAARQLLVITGGPGTGKTTSVTAILDLYDHMGISAILAAPTGRASKRMQEITGREACTIHRLLEAGWSGEGDQLHFARDEKNPLKCSAVVLDECSMVDIELMSALLRALPMHCRLVLVGDADQLPAVGPGNVLNDILRSGVVECIRLTEIFRQKSDSRIVTGAHAINRGQLPDLKENRGDLFFLRRKDAQAAVDTITELCARRLPENMGIPAAEIQVLTPTRKGAAGTAALNRALQHALNPPDREKAEHRHGDIVFRVGDRVMQIRNNYDILWRGTVGTELGAQEPFTVSGSGIFNGDIGRILAIDNAAELLSVDFDGRTAEYPFEMLNELEHAFAITVHKSQGSEYRCVVLCLGRGAPALMHRGVLYTAVTRARELLVIVGDDEAVAEMAANYRQTRRYSGLRARLAAAGEEQST